MKISEQYIAIEKMKSNLMKSNYLENFQSANVFLETIGKEFPMEKDFMGAIRIAIVVQIIKSILHTQ